MPTLVNHLKQDSLSAGKTASKSQEPESIRNLLDVVVSAIREVVLGKHIWVF